VPIVVTQDQQRKWLHARATGELTIDDVVGFLRTARSGVDTRMLPLIFDARGCTTSLTLADVPTAVAIVGSAVRSSGLRAHVALVSDDDRLRSWFVEYEGQCAAIGVRVICAFSSLENAEHWLEIVWSARNFHS
jgi:hypothetical protein